MRMAVSMPIRTCRSVVWVAASAKAARNSSSAVCCSAEMWNAAATLSSAAFWRSLRAACAAAFCAAAASAAALREASSWLARAGENAPSAKMEAATMPRRMEMVVRFIVLAPWFFCRNAILPQNPRHAEIIFVSDCRKIGACRSIFGDAEEFRKRQNR